MQCCWPAQRRVLDTRPEPNSDPKSNQQAAYFELYKVTADALKQVDQTSFAVGGPATAGCPGWSADLVAFGLNTSTAVDFVSCHSYGGGADPGCAGCGDPTVGNIPSLDGGDGSDQARRGRSARRDHGVELELEL